MKIKQCGKRLLVGGLALAQTMGQAAPYVLSQAPQNTAVQEPPPNVIVSVDNSGSMRYSSNSADGAREPTPGTLTRMQALQQALRSNFASSAIQDSRIRLSWQAMNNNTNNSCVGFLGNTSPSYGASGCTINGRPNANSMRLLDSLHRQNFMTWIDGLTPGGGTPLHAMMTRAGEYMKTTGPENPYGGDVPGTANASLSSCRKTFHILMTDGEYNFFGLAEDPSNLQIPNVGNADGTAVALPAGAPPYAPRAPFGDMAGRPNNRSNWIVITKPDGTLGWQPTSEYRPTLADLAFSYWATDLQPGVADNVPLIQAVASDQVIGGTTVPKFWNPRNDLAAWQHMNTSTIGFGTAASWTGRPLIDPNASEPTYSGDYPQLVAGAIGWPDPLANTVPGTPGYKGWYGAGPAVGYWQEDFTEGQMAAVRMDLWHAAINGRGTFTPASNATALNNAFQSILANILTNTSAPLTSIVANSSKLQAGAMLYRAGYDNADWSGSLQASQFGSSGGTAVVWSATPLLDARVAGTGFDNNRIILSHNGTRGVAFRWGNINPAQQAALQGAVITPGLNTTAGQNVLNYLRGDRSKETSTPPDRRIRRHVLGDIVGSAVWYTGQPNDGFLGNGYAQFTSSKSSRKKMLYVGANDGMLHGFNADDGQEVFSYVPKGVYGSASAPLLKNYTDPGYQHRYFVDGSPFVGDVNLGNATNWKSLLVGTLGAGGKGYFILDVTDPGNVSESAASNTVLMDVTDGSDADIGYEFQQPTVGGTSGRAKQFVRLNNNRPAVILGNGYNSTNEKAVLLIQYLDGARELLKIYAPPVQVAGGGNGLSAPQIVDRDGDGKVDLIYAGDLQGHLWKFDLSSTDPTKWKATSGKAIGNTTDDLPLFQTDTNQPITSAPVVVAHPRGGFMVVFGTGRMFVSGDSATTTTQTLYGIWDDSNGTVPKSSLVGRGVTALKTINGTTYRQIPKGTPGYGGADGKRGWFLDLPDSRERVVLTGEALNGGVGSFTTLIPGSASDSGSCISGAPDSGWAMVLDLFGGGAIGTDVFSTGDVAGPQFAGFKLEGVSRVISLRKGPAGDDTVCDTNGNCKDVNTTKVGRRFGWRNLVPLK